MNQSRRGFLSLLTGLVATATLDPERLLWVPGKKLISIPSVSTSTLVGGNRWLTTDEITRVVLEIMNSNLVWRDAVNQEYSKAFDAGHFKVGIDTFEIRKPRRFLGLTST